MKVTNTGDKVWENTGINAVRLGIHFTRYSIATNGGPWMTDQRWYLPAPVAPGASLTLSVTVKAPSTWTPEAPPRFIQAQMVREGVAWFTQVRSTGVTMSL
ncbi:MAG: hypothetical protein ACR2KK_23855 [Acidimicrobiales bacterium]